ncbi:MAG: 2-oxo acid dehydrogenase subunit E2 [Candidatus Methylomirabilis sp.]|nr:2-oxo acid dehydrogenase subunit E2 [Deltaproteobacteria bacterium]
MGSRFKEVKKLSSWRKIALHAWRDVGDPTVYGSMEVDATNALAYIRMLREKTGLHVTITHVVAKAIAHAIAKCPDINGVVLGTKILMRESIDVFLLVAIDEGSDLSGAKIRHADRKSVADIARELVERQQRLRAHKDMEVEPTQYLLRWMPDFLVGPMLGLIGKLSYDWDIDLHRIGVPYDQFGSAIVTSFGMFGLGLGLAPLVPSPTRRSLSASAR